MASRSPEQLIKDLAEKIGVPVEEVQAVDLGLERLYVCSVEEEYHDLAVNYRLELQNQLNEILDDHAIIHSLSFKEVQPSITEQKLDGHGLTSAAANRLRRLIDTRSRTTMAMPSLQYQENASASIEMASSVRNMIFCGRRGVGKTALLLQLYNHVINNGHMAVWLNCHIHRKATAEEFAATVFKEILNKINELNSELLNDEISSLDIAMNQVIEGTSPLGSEIHRLNSILRAVFRDEEFSLYIILDDLYMLPMEKQPLFLDLIFRASRDASVALKIGTIINLTRHFDMAENIGIQVPDDAKQVDLDRTLEDPRKTQAFLESILKPYLEKSGYGTISKLINPQARGRLVLASGGVPRDYLTILSLAMDKAAEKVERAVKVTAEAVNAAAGASQSARRADLYSDVKSFRDTGADIFLKDMGTILNIVRDTSQFTYFRVDTRNCSAETEERIGRLVDLRFIHSVWSGFSDKKGADSNFDGYTLNLADFSERRLFRKLSLLDIEKGQWIKKQTGTSGGPVVLKSNSLRDELLRSPLLGDLEDC